MIIHDESRRNTSYYYYQDPHRNRFLLTTRSSKVMFSHLRVLELHWLGFSGCDVQSYPYGPFNFIREHPRARYFRPLCKYLHFDPTTHGHFTLPLYSLVKNEPVKSQYSYSGSRSCSNSVGSVGSQPQSQRKRQVHSSSSLSIEDFFNP